MRLHGLVTPCKTTKPGAIRLSQLSDMLSASSVAPRALNRTIREGGSGGRRAGKRKSHVLEPKWRTCDVRRRQNLATFWQRQQGKCRHRPPHILRRYFFVQSVKGEMGYHTSRVFFTRCPMATKPPKVTITLRLPPGGRPTYR